MEIVVYKSSMEHNAQGTPYYQLEDTEAGQHGFRFKPVRMVSDEVTAYHSYL